MDKLFEKIKKKWLVMRFQRGVTSRVLQICGKTQVTHHILNKTRREKKKRLVKYKACSILILVMEVKILADCKKKKLKIIFMKAYAHGEKRINLNMF